MKWVVEKRPMTKDESVLYCRVKTSRTRGETVIPEEDEAVKENWRHLKRLMLGMCS